MTFTIKKLYLQSLGNWLNNLALNGKQTRARTRFVEVVQEALTRIEKDRKAIVEEFAEKDAKGEFKYIENNGQKNYDVPNDKMGDLNKELAEMYQANAELSGPEFGPIILIVKDIVLNYDKEIEPGLSVMYNEWCKAFEAFPPVQGI